MPYATVADLRAVLAPADTPVGTAAEMADTDLQAALDEVEAVIDARLSPRYAVPFDPVPEVITTVTRDIAAYSATLTYRKGNPLTDDDPVARRYKAAMALVVDLMAGKADLPAPQGSGFAEADVENQYEGELFRLEDLMLGSQGYAPVPGPYRSIRMT